MKRRTPQYVVVYLPTGDLNASAVGPFRSRAIAEMIRDAIEQADEGRDFSAAPQLVTLTNLAAALEEVRVQ